METDKVLPGTYKTLPVDPSPDPEIHAVSKNEPGDYADSGANKSENDGSTSSGDDSFESLSYEEAMSKYGSGRYQVIIFILLSLVTFSCVFNNNGYIFIGATQEHRCKVPDSSNWTDFNNKTAFYSILQTCVHTTSGPDMEMSRRKYHRSNDRRGYKVLQLGVR
ncbi:hypothetical protein EB796_003901 [Bugula neritina]|uniref:Uncharacterized protein n=1 Tax=Bugula neritina TaxID=10212 RepID=A0A7J7KIP5_BUGNE|nr:hypothetical protein EB796_003901 [Bugula neritina]